MSDFGRALQRRWLWLAVNIAASLPLLWTAWDFQQDNMIEPIAAFTGRTGQATIILLLLTLAVTPLVTVTGYRQLLRVRKSLGLWTFAYATMHFLVFAGVDYGFDLDFILRDGLPKKPYVVVGFLALLILLPLAITSTRGWMRRLGRNWTRLHKWIYAAGMLGVLHYIWVVKIDLARPLLYTAILAVLLMARIPPVRRTLAGLRRTDRKPKSAQPTIKRSPAAMESR